MASSNLAVLGIFLIQLFPNWTACSPITYRTTLFIHLKLKFPLIIIMRGNSIVIMNFPFSKMPSHHMHALLNINVWNIHIWTAGKRNGGKSSSQLFTQLKLSRVINCELKRIIFSLIKIQASTGIKPRTSAMPVQCSVIPLLSYQLLWATWELVILITNLTSYQLAW